MANRLLSSIRPISKAISASPTPCKEGSCASTAFRRAAAADAVATSGFQARSSFLGAQQLIVLNQRHTWTIEPPDEASAARVYTIGRSDDSTLPSQYVPSNAFLRISNSYCGELFHNVHLAFATRAALNCGSALGIFLGDNEPALVVIDLGGSVFKRRSSVPHYGILDHPNALCTFVTPRHQPFQTPL